ncbi:MAG: DUF1173 family protein [Pseudomonadota bacterium]
MDEQRFLIDGCIYAASDARLQNILARIYESAERPRCMCIPGGIEMYVAKHRLLLIKRMPETGARHHPSCPSYESELGQSGLGELMGDAIIEHSPVAVELRVDFPLVRITGLRITGRAIPNGERHEPAEVQVARRCMSLRAVTHFLFERAGLNRWTPAMEGKRNQGVLHKYLTEAAEDVVTKGLRLSERLYVPEPFNETTKTAAAERRRGKLAILQSNCEGDGFNMALVLGEFKVSEAAALGRKVWIKHMSDAPLFINTKGWERIERVYGSLLEARDADTAHKPRVLIAALIYAKREHTYQIDTASLLLATEQWIPIDGMHEIDLIDTLVAHQRRFIKPLRYDAKSAAPFPNALLLDAGAAPVALHVMSGFMEPKDRAIKEKVLKSGATMPWVWRTDQPMPDLPPVARWNSIHR